MVTIPSLDRFTDESASLEALFCLLLQAAKTLAIINKFKIVFFMITPF
jgi:hypothetical protein